MWWRQLDDLEGEGGNGRAAMLVDRLEDIVLQSGQSTWPDIQAMGRGWGHLSLDRPRRPYCQNAAAPFRYQGPERVIPEVETSLR